MYIYICTHTDECIHEYKHTHRGTRLIDQINSFIGQFAGRYITVG